jgi:TPP-dependent indolepyruvate ferredoxin oxidoreductase alpha subunit
MAERFFKKEVQKLYLGRDQEFRGEGILAVTKALLQSGVSYVAGYQGAPISHLMDVLTEPTASSKNSASISNTAPLKPPPPPRSPLP